MNRVGAPFDEERKKAGLIIVEIEGLPLEEAAIGALARAGSRTIESEASAAKTARELMEIAGMSGPAYEARLVEFSEGVKIRG